MHTPLRFSSIITSAMEKRKTCLLLNTQPTQDAMITAPQLTAPHSCSWPLRDKPTSTGFQNKANTHTHRAVFASAAVLLFQYFPPLAVGNKCCEEREKQVFHRFCLATRSFSCGLFFAQGQTERLL